MSENIELLESVARMSRDTAKAAAVLTSDQARFLVDAYYTMQDNRLRTDSQIRSLAESGEPNTVMEWLSEQNSTLEKQIARALEQYTRGHEMGSWMREVFGIGPILSAGMLAHIDISRCPTAGHIWRYAGLDPTVKWIGAKGATDTVKAIKEGNPGVSRDVLVALCAQAVNRRVGLYYEFLTKKGKSDTPANLQWWLSMRPWNPQLKTLCYKIGESFVKFSNSDKCFYGHLYRNQKADYIVKNEAGGFAEAAAEGAARVGKETDAYAAYSIGKLPPAHIHAMARRWAVKIFLSHLHREWFIKHFGEEPPKPFAIEILGHAHMIEAPV